jgi:hypothetical protein
MFQYRNFIFSLVRVSILIFLNKIFIFSFSGFNIFNSYPFSSFLNADNTGYSS